VETDGNWIRSLAKAKGGEKLLVLPASLKHIKKQKDFVSSYCRPASCLTMGSRLLHCTNRWVPWKN